MVLDPAGSVKSKNRKWENGEWIVSAESEDKHGPIKPTGDSQGRHRSSVGIQKTLYNFSTPQGLKGV